MFRALLEIDADDLRDDIARALQLHDIAFADILARDFVFVMQRGAAYDHAADSNGFQFGDGRERACAPDLNDDFFEPRRRLFGGEFMRDRPARRAADETEPFLPIEAVRVYKPRHRCRRAVHDVFLRSRGNRQANPRCCRKALPVR